MKRFIFIVVALSATIQVFAQTHLIEVARLKNWGSDYLTVTCTYTGYCEDKNSKCYPSFDIVSKTASLSLGSIITAINDESTKGMNADRFYEILDANEKLGVKLSFLTRDDLRQGEIIIKKRSSLPDLFTKSGITLEKVVNGTWTNDSQDLLSKRKAEYERCNIYTSELVDNDFDWGYARTYDFVIRSQDVLVEKKLLEEFAKRLCAWMKRDTTNPDVLLAVSKNADESITTTYVPPTSRTINTGSTITPNYSYLTKQTSYTTENHYQTVTEGGYNKTTRTADLFIELSILDAKRINDVNQTAPPIIYQFTMKRHVVNPEFNLMDELMKYCASPVKCDPFYCMYETKTFKFHEPAIKFDDNGVVTYVLEGSQIQRDGLMVGDKMLAHERSYLKNNGYWTFRWIKGCGEGREYKLLRNGKTLRIESYYSFKHNLGEFEFSRLRPQED